MNLSALLGSIEDARPHHASSLHVIFWGQDDLFAQAIESFLETRKRLRVVRILPEQGEDHLLQQVDALHPEAVILYLGNCPADEQLPTRILQGQPDLKVMTVSRENNRVQVLHKHDVILQEASDLLSIIES